MTADMDLVSLISQFSSDDQCRTALEQMRWPNGVACLRCGSLTVYRLPKRNLFECKDCTYQFSVTTGTVLHDTHLPLQKWFLATYIMVESKKGISANQLKRMIKVSYKTSWYLTHRVRHAMGLVVGEQLGGIIEADETFVGGKYRYARTDKDMFGNMKKGPRPDSNKTIVLGALERGGDVRMRVSGGGRSKKAITSFIDAEADNITQLYSDDLPVYQGVAKDLKVAHDSTNHTAKEWVRGDVHTNGMESVWSLLKRSIIGSYHQLSEKHLDAYLAELEWRFNNRDSKTMFTDTMRALLSAEALEYKVLTQQASSLRLRTREISTA